MSSKDIVRFLNSLVISTFYSSINNKISDHNHDYGHYDVLDDDALKRLHFCPSSIVLIIILLY